MIAEVIVDIAASETDRIFDYLCEHGNIKAEESIFIDDNKANIAGADAYGIHTYLFDGDSGKLKAYLDSLLSE